MINSISKDLPFVVSTNINRSPHDSKSFKRGKHAFPERTGLLLI